MPRGCRSGPRGAPSRGEPREAARPGGWASLAAAADDSDDGTADGALGLELLRRGRYAEALAAHRRFLDAAVRACGPTHPDVGRAFGNLGLAHDGLGELHESLAMHRAALAILSAGGGEDAARAAHSVGAALYRMGRLDEARAQLEAARDAWSRAGGPRHPGVADALGGIGTLLLNQVPAAPRRAAPAAAARAARASSRASAHDASDHGPKPVTARAVVRSRSSSLCRAPRQ